MISVTDTKIFEQVEDYLRAVPYDVTRCDLYTPSTLYEGYTPRKPSTFENCYDQRIYKHYLSTGKKANSALENLARSLHDYDVTEAINNFLAHYDKFSIVAVMGGHGLRRTDPMYKEIVLLSMRLTLRGALMASGCGPGAMEATHLGAWLAGRTEEEVEEALYMLSFSPSFSDKEWLESAFAVMRKFPQTEFKSLGIPTWLYGHEPATPFATHIAKFFENSIREDTLLNIALGGIIFTPGSAGTLQEIFQDTVANHYLSFGISSPMIVFGRQFWDEEIPIYPFMEEMVEKGRYQNLRLTLTDSADEVVQELLQFHHSLNEDSKP